MILGRKSFEATARNALNHIGTYLTQDGEPSDKAVTYMADFIGRIYSIGLHDGMNNRHFSMPRQCTPKSLDDGRRNDDEEKRIGRSYE